MKQWKQEEWEEYAPEKEPQGPVCTAEEGKKACEKAVYYLQFSGKTESELRKKLAEQEFSPASVDYAIEFVKRRRYLDDEDYARRFVEKNGHKKSKKQMIFDLTQKGVSREILDLVFEDMDVDEEAQILTILDKRGYSGEDATREEKQKISAYLARKGFSYDAIQSALNQYARKN